MTQSGRRNNLAVLLVGLFLLFAPALFVVATLEFLILTGDLVLSDITALEFLELYLIELVLFAGISYGIYRLTLWVVAHRLPESVDTAELREGSLASDDASGREATGNDRQ